MIFYNSELMPDTSSATLFMVTNSEEFERYEDHEAGIYIQLHILVELSIESGENPIALIENYLGITYTEGKTVAEIADFLAQTDKLQNALWGLELRWQKKSESVLDISKKHGGIGKEKAVKLYTQTTLRSYLEALAKHTND